MSLPLRSSLDALVAELKRLRSEGVDSVYLEGATLAVLKEHARGLEADGFAEALAREFGGARGTQAGVPAAGSGFAVGKLGSASAGKTADKSVAGQPAAGNTRTANAGAGADSQSPARPNASTRKKRSEFSDGSEDFLSAVAKEQAQEGAAQTVSAVSGASPRAGKKGGQGLPPGVAPIPDPVPFELPEGDKQTQWNWLLNKVQTDAVCLEHLKEGKKLVLGTGSLDADIFFCGEAPGQEEENEGEPFVGPAGQLLTKIIQAMGLQRQQVYIGNIMNWRPEHDKPYGNRAPVEAEIRYCLPHLLAQLQIVRPKVIVALGLIAANGLLGFDPNRRVGDVRGRWLEAFGYPLMITYHPSYLLRNDTLSAKRIVWEDLMQVMEKTGLPITPKQRTFFTRT